MSDINEAGKIDKALRGLPACRTAHDGRVVAYVDAHRLVSALLTATGTVAFATETGRVTYFFAPNSEARLWITGRDKLEASREAHSALRQRTVQPLPAGDVEGWALQLLVSLVSDSVLAEWLDSLLIQEL